MFADLLSRTLAVVGDTLPADVMAGLNRVVGPAAGPAWDCPMLYVALADVTRTEDARGCVVHTDVTLRVGVVRAVCTVDSRGIAPSPAQVTSDGLVIAEDAWHVQEVLDGLTPEQVGVYGRVDVGGWTPLGPEGGMGGGEWTVRVRVVH